MKFKEYSATAHQACRVAAVNSFPGRGFLAFLLFPDNSVAVLHFIEPRAISPGGSFGPQGKALGFIFVLDFSKDAPICGGIYQFHSPSNLQRLRLPHLTQLILSPKNCQHRELRR